MTGIPRGTGHLSRQPCIASLAPAAVAGTAVRRGHISVARRRGRVSFAIGLRGILHARLPEDVGSVLSHFVPYPVLNIRGPDARERPFHATLVELWKSGHSAGRERYVANGYSLQAVLVVTFSEVDRHFLVRYYRSNTRRGPLLMSQQCIPVHF